MANLPTEMIFNSANSFLIIKNSKIEARMRIQMNFYINIGWSFLSTFSGSISGYFKVLTILPATDPKTVKKIISNPKLFTN